MMKPFCFYCDGRANKAALDAEDEGWSSSNNSTQTQWTSAMMIALL